MERPAKAVLGSRKISLFIHIVDADIVMQFWHLRIEFQRLLKFAANVAPLFRGLTVCITPRDSPSPDRLDSTHVLSPRISLQRRGLRSYKTWRRSSANCDKFCGRQCNSMLNLFIGLVESLLTKMNNGHVPARCCVIRLTGHYTFNVFPRLKVTIEINQRLTGGLAGLGILRFD